MAYPYQQRNNFGGRYNNHHGIRANQFIRAREVYVIDADGKPAGNMQTLDAINLAKRSGLDLVEVSPNANPPVCKILDFGKYRYEQSKREKGVKKNTGASKLKELSLKMNIAANDYEIKMRRAEGFMWKGMKVKFEMKLRGRENLHKDIAEEIMRKIAVDLASVSVADQEPKVVGRSIILMLSPLPLHKRTRKYTHEDMEEIEEEEDDETEDSESAETAPTLVEQKKG